MKEIKNSLLNSIKRLFIKKDEEEDGDNYFVFISYSHKTYKNRRWAKKLLDRFDHYQLPKSYSGRKNLRKVFRDREELSGGKEWDNQVKKIFDKTENLVVVCSPEAAESEPIKKEIKTFIEKKGTDHIFPFVIEGEPNDCFPDGINTSKIAGDINKDGREQAFIKIVAGMLEKNYDDLWKRRERELKNRHRIIVALLSIIVSSIIFCLFYHLPTYSYFADYVDKWGIPEGIIELTKEQQQHRHRMYEFEYHRIPFGEPGQICNKRITAVRYVNSAHTPQEIDDAISKSRYPIQKIEYNKQTGDAAQLIFCDTKERVVLRHMLSENNGQKACIADFIAPQEQKGIGYVESYLNGSRQWLGERHAKITRFVYKRNANGYIISKTYHKNNDDDLAGSTISDADGIYGCSYVVDSLGRHVWIDHIDEQGHLIGTHNGIAGKRLAYDQYSNICFVAYTDTQRNLIANDHDCAKERYISDGWGNIIESTYYTPEGKPCYCAKRTYDYDDKGNMIATSCLDEYGQFMAINEYTTVHYKYDDKGNKIEEEYIGSDGRPYKGSLYGSYAKAIYKYDKNNYLIEESYFDDKGKPMTQPHDATISYAYDNHGNIIEKSYSVLNAEGLPYTAHPYNAKITYKYDDQDRNIEVAYWDSEGQPFMRGGHSKITRKYDKRGNLIEEAFWEADDIPGTPGIKGAALDNLFKLSIIHDDHGNAIAYKAYDKNGNEIQ